MQSVWMKHLDWLCEVGIKRIKLSKIEGRGKGRESEEESERVRERERGGWRERDSDKQIERNTQISEAEK